MAKIGPFRNFPMDQPSGENIKGSSQKEFKLPPSPSPLPDPIPTPQKGHVKEWLWNFKLYLLYIHGNVNAEHYSEVKRFVEFIEREINTDGTLDLIKKETGVDLNGSFLLDHISDEFHAWAPVPGGGKDLKLEIDQLIESLADIQPPGAKNH